MLEKQSHNNNNNNLSNKTVLEALKNVNTINIQLIIYKII